MTTEVFYRGLTIEIRAYFQHGGADVSPDQGVAITIWDKAGTKKVDAAAMTELDTGDYAYYYTPAADAVQGGWTYYYKGQDGTGGTAKYGGGWGSFEVK
jgi:hypothetical protein